MHRNVENHFQSNQTNKRASTPVKTKRTKIERKKIRTILGKPQGILNAKKKELLK